MDHWLPVSPCHVAASLFPLAACGEIHRMLQNVTKVRSYSKTGNILSFLAPGINDCGSCDICWCYEQNGACLAR